MPPCDRGGNCGDAARLRARGTLGGESRDQDGSGGADGDGVPAGAEQAWRATAGGTFRGGVPRVRGAGVEGFGIGWLGARRPDIGFS